MSDQRFETYVVETEGMSVDLIIWRRYRRPIEGLVEKTLANNPGIAGQGPYLTVGTVIRVPYVPPKTTPTQDVVRLWT